MLVCEKCSAQVTALVYKDARAWCWSCNQAAKGVPFGQSAMIATDDIPGGLEVKHGLCNPDGTPRKFYSKSAIKQEAFETGWSISGDTPKVNQRLVEQREAANLHKTR